MATAERMSEVPANPHPAEQVQMQNSESLIEVNPFLLELPVRGNLPPSRGLRSSKSPPSGYCGAAVPADLLEAAKKQCAGQKIDSETSFFLTKLSNARKASIAATESSSSTDVSVTETVTAYLELLQGLTGPLGKGPDSPSARETSSAVGSATAGFNGPSGSLNYFLEFQYWEGFQSSSGSAAVPKAGGAAFEAAQTLLSLALWKAAAAARLVNKSAVTPKQSLEAYRLMREAAGIAQELQKEPYQSAALLGKSADLDRGLLAALNSCWLSDAQSLTVARAIAKGSSNTVVAAVALDCALLYEAAGSCPGESKFHEVVKAYAAFKAMAMRGYANIHHAQKLLEDDLAAEALRSSAEATDALKKSQEAAATFDKTLPKGTSVDHSPFQRHVKNTVERAADRISRINSAVHYKAPASELPELPPASRLADPIPPVFPVISSDALSVLEALGRFSGGQDSMASETATSGAQSNGLSQNNNDAGTPIKPAEINSQEAEERVGCCSGVLRWIAVLVAMPILVVASLVGVVVWIVLLPFKLPCCCCLGCLAQIAWDVVEWLIKAPARGLLYAAGKPWKPDATRRPKGTASDPAAANV